MKKRSNGKPSASKEIFRGSHVSAPVGNLGSGCKGPIAESLACTKADPPRALAESGVQDSGSGVCQLGRFLIDTFLISTWGTCHLVSFDLFRHSEDSSILFSVEKATWSTDKSLTSAKPVWERTLILA